MRSSIKSLVLAFAALLLASCGGGGGGSSGSGFTTAPLTVTVQANSSSTPNSLVSVVVRATSNNQPLPDGTTVTLRVSPPGVGLVSAVQTNSNGGPANIAESVTNTLSGGGANFRLHTRAVGTVTLTASVVDPAQPARTVTGTANVAVNAGAPSDPRVTLAATATSLPINGGLVQPFLGSPYLSEVTITQRTLDGSLVAGTVNCNVAATPVTNGAFSTLDDPETEDINEFFVLLGNGGVDVTGGRGTIFVSSFNRPGPLTITVVCTDPQTLENVSSVLTINIGNGSPQLPASVVIATESTPVYVQGVGGTTSLPIEVGVLDGGGAFVPDPATGVNNVRLEIVGGAQGGERLTSISASGAPQQGASVVARSGNGLANFTYQSGTRSGIVTLRATSDRADNNIDNGITDPVTSTRQIVVSDGRLFELEISGGPLQGATNVNTTFNDSTGIYTTVVSALATDRNSQPVAPGTAIRWGLVDEPQNGGIFTISGTNGDPSEGGTTFTAVGGRFDLAQPGDTLLLFGNEPAAGTPDNRDLEGARRIASIQSPTALTVTERFNLNRNSQGTSINNGPVIQYAIGHPADANIVGARRVVTEDPDNPGQFLTTFVSTGSPESTTDSFGRTYALLTYTRTALGKPVLLWAQGSGDLVVNTPEQIGDVEAIQLQGAGPTTITVAPAAIFPNRVETLQVCVRDSEGIPQPNQTLLYSFSTPSGGEIIGSSGGIVAQRTGANGCVVVQVRVNSAGAGGTLTFSVLGDPEATGTVTVEAAGAVTVTATPQPAFLIPNTASSTVEAVSICVVTETGGVQNVPVTLVTCGTPVLTPGTAPGVTPTFQAFSGANTGADGCTQVGVQYQNLGSGFSATCSYAAGTAGTVSVTYQVQ